MRKASFEGSPEQRRATEQVPVMVAMVPALDDSVVLEANVGEPQCMPGLSGKDPAT